MSFNLVENVIDCGSVFRKTDRDTLLAIAKRAHSRTLECFPSYQDVAWLGQISPSTAIKSVKRLERLGFIFKLKGGPRRTNHYWVNSPLLKYIKDHLHDLKSKAHRLQKTDWRESFLKPEARRIQALLECCCDDRETNIEDDLENNLSIYVHEFKGQFQAILEADIGSSGISGTAADLATDDSRMIKLGDINKESNQNIEKITSGCRNDVDEQSLLRIEKAALLLLMTVDEFIERAGGWVSAVRVVDSWNSRDLGKSGLWVLLEAARGGVDDFSQPFDGIPADDPLCEINPKLGSKSQPEQDGQCE